MPPSNADEKQPVQTGRASVLLEWIRTLGPLLVSWPMVGIVAAFFFHEPIGGLIDRVAKSEDSGRIEAGPFKVEIGRATGKPPAERASAGSASQPAHAAITRIDLSETIGPIRDQGETNGTVGYSLAYAMQAALVRRGTPEAVSAAGIYKVARQKDEFPGDTEDEGTSLHGGLRAVAEVGAYRLKDWPDTRLNAPNPGAKPFTKAARFERFGTSDFGRVIAELSTGSVVVVTVNAVAGFDAPEPDGRVRVAVGLTSNDLLMTIAIVGYDSSTNDFRFAMSWGTSWGNKGFGVIKDTDLKAIAVEFAVIYL